MRTEGGGSPSVRFLFLFVMGARTAGSPSRGFNGFGQARLRWMKSFSFASVMQLMMSPAVAQALGDEDSEFHLVEIGAVVGVGVDGELDAGGECAVGVGVVEIQPREGGVDLQGGAGVGGGLENPGEIQRQALPAENQPARWDGRSR